MCAWYSFICYEIKIQFLTHYAISSVMEAISNVVRRNFHLRLLNIKSDISPGSVECPRVPLSRNEPSRSTITWETNISIVKIAESPAIVIIYYIIVGGVKFEISIEIIV